MISSSFLITDIIDVYWPQCKNTVQATSASTNVKEKDIIYISIYSVYTFTQNVQGTPCNHSLKQFALFGTTSFDDGPSSPFNNSWICLWTGHIMNFCYYIVHAMLAPMACHSWYRYSLCQAWIISYHGPMEYGVWSMVCSQELGRLVATSTDNYKGNVVLPSPWHVSLLQ